ncbi:hypothetical protein ACWEO1_20575 [Kitasatospora cineracea]
MRPRLISKVAIAGSSSNGDCDVLALTLNDRSSEAGTTTASHNHSRR